MRIIDFGIALVADSEMSRIEGIAGSPSYMSPEQVQSHELTHHSDLYSLGAVMYELLTGIRPFRAGNLVKLLHQIVYATPPPIHTQRKDVPEELEADRRAWRCSRLRTSARSPAPDFAAELTRVHQRLREQNARIDQQEQFDVLRRLRFFHDFSHAEIWEVLRASTMQDYAAGEEIVQGRRHGRPLLRGRERQVHGGAPRQGARGRSTRGDCFGETSYVRGARRTATIRAETEVTVLTVSSTLLEQVSAACQLRFNRVFLRSLIARLQGNDQPSSRAHLLLVSNASKCVVSFVAVRLRNFISRAREAVFLPGSAASPLPRKSMKVSPHPAALRDGAAG